MPFLSQIKRINIPSLFWLVTIVLFLFYLNYPNIQNAGDVIEYYGTTESILNHGGINLTPQDKSALSSSISPGYFNDNQYYLTGKNGEKYPVHFAGYSLMMVPMRLALRSIGQDERMTFVFTNLLILTLTVFYLFRYFVVKRWQQLLLLLGIYLSPFISFISWPGPELMIMCLLLLSVFLLYKEQYLFALLFAVLATWQSQPLIIIPFFYCLVALYAAITHKDIKMISAVVVVGGLVFIPNLLNILLFGTLSPWTLFSGKHLVSVSNITTQKFLELFIDPNLGLVWYGPFLLMGGLIIIIKRASVDLKTALLLTTLLLVALAYETNANWNNGTAGFGPTRYIIFMIPYLIYFITTYLSKNLTSAIILGLTIVVQFLTLSVNGGLSPQFVNSLYHTPYSQYILKTMPEWYNPTAEIFVERTLHTEPDSLIKATYKEGTACFKTFVPQGQTENSSSCLAQKKVSLFELSKGLYISYGN